MKKQLSKVRVASLAIARENSFTQMLWNIKGAIVLALMVTLLPACAGTREEAVTPEAGNVTTEDVAENTNQLLGRVVTIRSEPVKKIGTNAFTVEDNEFLNNENILVVNASGQPLVLPEDDVEVQVTGKVTKYVVADFEREYGFNLEPQLEAEYRDKPAIVAQSIALAPEPGEITKNPAQYYGKTLAVTGEIEDIVGPNSFTLDEDKLLGTQDLLVLSAIPAAAIKDGETVAVTGELRPFVVADIERDYDLTWDLDLQRKLEVEYKDKPVFIAKGVYPSAIPDIAK
ncbi:MAG: hypothetical protein AB1589_11030 [Cyanobacteriota bacterium]